MWSPNIFPKRAKHQIAVVNKGKDIIKKIFFVEKAVSAKVILEY